MHTEQHAQLKGPIPVVLNVNPREGQTKNVIKKKHQVKLGGGRGQRGMRFWISYQCFCYD